MLVRIVVVEKTLHKMNCVAISIQFNLFGVHQIQEGSLDPEDIEHVN